MSRAALGAKVRYCGHDGWFIADIYVVDGVNVVKANGKVTPDNLIRPGDEATHWLKDFPQAGMWCPDRGIFVVPKNQVLVLGTNEELVEDLKRFYGISPYDKDGNVCKSDGLFYKSLEDKYGKEEVEKTKRIIEIFQN